jgi:hypothetical protein
MLVKEEMRRVLRFLDYKTAWWMDRVGARISEEEELRSGIAGYARRQAWLLGQTRERFRFEWENPSRKIKRTAMAPFAELRSFSGEAVLDYGNI